MRVPFLLLTFCTITIIAHATTRPVFAQFLTTSCANNTIQASWRGIFGAGIYFLQVSTNPQRNQFGSLVNPTQGVQRIPAPITTGSVSVPKPGTYYVLVSAANPANIFIGVDPPIGQAPKTQVCTNSTLPTTQPSANPTASASANPPGPTTKPLPTLEPGVDTKLDIVYIADKYIDMAEFKKDAEKFQKTFLSYEPFKSKSSQIQFRAIENRKDLGCKRDSKVDRVVICNNAKVSETVNDAKVPYDSIVVIVKDAKYGGSGGKATNIAIATNGQDGEQVAVHEMGHSLGGLLDEYTFGTTGPIDNKVKDNCYAGSPPFTGWGSLIKPGDYAKGCTNTNWYRSSQTSLMKDITTHSFNEVSKKLLHEKIDYFTKRK